MNSDRRWKLAIVSSAAVAFLTKILLALNTYGTNDVYAWERFAHWSALFGSGLYNQDAAFNHPPSMIHVLAAMMWLAKSTGIAFPFWLRLPAILADAGGLYIVYRIFAPRLDEPSVRWALLLVALSPTLILVSGFHGNTDPVVMFFLLLSVWITQDALFEGDATDWAAGAAFGAAMCVKVLPLIVLPVLFFCRRSGRRRVIFLAAAGAVMILCWSPYLFRNPLDILRQVIGYQSIYGHWGLSWLAYLIPAFPDSWHDKFQHYGAYVVLAAIVTAAWWMNRDAVKTKPSIYAQVGATLFLFLAAANGFGVQYLAWLVPWTVGFSIVPVAFFTAASGIFLFFVYNFWSGGFPWYLADSEYYGDFAGHIDYLLGVCWLSVVVLACSAWRWPQTLTFPGPRRRILLAVLAILVFAWPIRHQLQVDRRTYSPAVDHAALNSIYAHERALLSERYDKMGRYQDAVVTARTAAALDPALLEVWNNLARACIHMGRWDEALNAANRALELAPEDQTAGQNLYEATNHR